MTVYPPINPQGKPPCWLQQHTELIAGLCDACGGHARLYPIAEGPVCGPATICADCIWELTPRDLRLDRPLFAVARREIESRRRPGQAVSARVPGPARFLPRLPKNGHRPEQVCERQLAFDFATLPPRQPRPTGKTTPPAATGARPPAKSIAHARAVQCPPAAGEDATVTQVINGDDGIPCDECGRLIRVYLDNVVVSCSGERCCLDCFEARHNLEPFITTAAWLDEHRDELEQDWWFVYDVDRRQQVQVVDQRQLHR
ncbi:MAG: hypothetical protein ACE5G8_16585, partial [Anaerolineae bacterium]